MKNISLHIADASEISRRGLVCLMEGSAHIERVHEHSRAKQLIDSFRSLPESICIISSTLSDIGLRDLMEELKKINPHCKVVLISGSSDIGHVNQALNAGVKGYVTRQVSAHELEQTIIAVHNGEQAFSRNISKTIVGHYTKKRNSASEPIRESITKREREVLSLIVQGLTSSEIAKRLYISPRTVETHRANLMQKLNIKNTAGLVRYALEEGESF